jgi:hypothetical protein
MKHFLPIAVIHVIVKNLGSVGQGRRSCRRRDGVQYGPQSFQYFAIDHSCSWDVMRSPSIKAFMLMSMDMKLSNCMNQFDMFGDV